MTFSIVARDPQTGTFGVATATAGPMVGALVPHIREGLGAAATQAMTNPYLAVDALAVIAKQNATEALRSALARDERRELRQIIVVDRNGMAAGWTGGGCIDHAGHLIGDGVAVAGNILAGEAVLTKMMAHYQSHLGKLSFAETLLGALRAGAEAGSDKRGLGSAALRVHGTQAFAEIDLRVDLSESPIKALDTLLDIATAGSYRDFFLEVPRR